MSYKFKMFLGDSEVCIFDYGEKPPVQFGFRYGENKVIPIKWIEKWLEAQERIVRINPPYYNQVTVRKLLEDWEKENES